MSVQSPTQRWESQHLVVNPQLIQRFEHYLHVHLQELHRYPEEEYPNLIAQIAQAVQLPQEQAFICKSAPEALEFFLEPLIQHGKTAAIEPEHPYGEVLYQQLALRKAQGIALNSAEAPHTAIAFIFSLQGAKAYRAQGLTCPVICLNLMPESVPQLVPSPVTYLFEWPHGLASANPTPPVFGFSLHPELAQTVRKIQEPFHIPTQLLALMSETVAGLLAQWPLSNLQALPSQHQSLPVLAPIASIKPYVPGKGIKRMAKELGMPESAFSKLASNEHPFGLATGFVDQIAPMLTRWGTHPPRYQDLAHDLKHLILENVNRPQWDEKQVCVGTGSVELIKAIIKAFVPEGGTVMFPAMPFAMYPFETQKRLAHIQAVSLSPALETDMNALVAAVKTLHPQVIFLANPRNPLGTALTSLTPLIEALDSDQVLVIDEAYVDFITQQMGPATYPNGLDALICHPGQKIIALRTFSKGLALASFRLGYSFSSVAVADALRAVMLPCPVDPFTMVAAMAAMSQPDVQQQVHEMVSHVLEAKPAFYQLFDSLGLKYIPSYANFIYFETGPKHTSQSLFDALVRQGVIIRPVLEGSARVNVGSPKENQHFIDAMRQAYQ